MYMSQHLFTPAPGKFDLWVPYNRNYMSLLARAPGAVLSRVLRETGRPERLYAVGLWTGHDAAEQWSDSPEALLGAKPGADQRLYEGRPMTWSRWELIDFAAGRDAADATVPGRFVKLATWPAAPRMQETQEAILRAALSLLARQPGFVCGETYRSHRGGGYQLLYTFREAGDWPLDGEPAAELRLLIEADAVRAIRKAVVDPSVLDCTVWDGAWGPEQAGLLAYEGCGEARRLLAPTR